MEEIIKWLDQVEEYDEDDTLFGEKFSVQLEKALASDNKKKLIAVADLIICNGYDNGEQYAERILFKAGFPEKDSIGNNDKFSKTDCEVILSLTL